MLKSRLLSTLLVVATLMSAGSEFAIAQNARELKPTRLEPQVSPYVVNGYRRNNAAGSYTPIQI
jgi:hypothetical protein